MPSVGERPFLHSLFTTPPTPTRPHAAAGTISKRSRTPDKKLGYLSKSVHACPKVAHWGLGVFTARTTKQHAAAGHFCRLFHNDDIAGEHLLSCTVSPHHRLNVDRFRRDGAITAGARQ